MTVIPPLTRKVLLSLQLEEETYAKVLQIAKDTRRRPAAVMKYLVEAGVLALETDEKREIVPSRESAQRADALATRQARLKAAKRK